MSDPTKTNTNVRKQYVVRNHRNEVDAAQGDILEAIDQMGYDQSDGFAVRLALEEALANAFKHGNLDDPERPVTIDLQIEPGRITIDVTDDGEGFDPGAVPDPTQNENVEIPSGRGLLLMRSFMTDVAIINPGNCVRMVYEKPA